MIYRFIKALAGHVIWVFFCFLPEDNFKGRKYSFLGDLSTFLGFNHMASSSYKKAISTEPQDICLTKKLIGALSRVKAYDEAAKICNSAAIDNPDYEVLYQWGKVLEKQGNYRDAIEKYTNCISLNPLFAPAYSSYANLLDEMGNYEEAIAMYKKALDLAPTNPHILVGLGLAFEANNEYDNACQMFINALTIEPDLAEAYFGWGIVLEKMKFYRDAIEKFQKALKIEPKFYEVYTRWGEVLYLMGDFNAAIEKFELAIKLNPQDTWALYDLACAYAKLDEVKTAVKFLKKAIKMDSTIIDDVKTNNNLTTIVSIPQIQSLLKVKQAV